jgi:GNAT superfamily N-acetyltransferase
MSSADSYELEDDRRRLDRDAIWGFLSREAYWGRWRSRSDVELQIENAWRVVGAFRGMETVGFARAVSDGVAIAYLADVFVVPDHRGRGLGRRLVSAMVEGSEAEGLRWLLHTDDAHPLYESFGFRSPDKTFLERPRSNS